MTYRFGVFEFDATRRELRKHGRLVALEPQPARALARLLSHPGAIVSRDELRRSVWDEGTHVDFDRGLAYCLSQIRVALGDAGANPRFVETLPRRGYRFIAPVAAAPSDGPAGPSTMPAETPAEVHATAPPGEVVPLRALAVGGLSLLVVLLVVLAGLVGRRSVPSPPPRVVVAVSIFDNETGDAAHDRLVAGLSDLVVARLTAVDPRRIAVVGNATVLRQPRNIRRLEALATALDAQYVLLGQLQRAEPGLRFVTHVIRLDDLTHLKANRIAMPDGNLTTLETAVVEEFERAVRVHILGGADR